MNKFLKFYFKLFNLCLTLIISKLGAQIDNSAKNGQNIIDLKIKLYLKIDTLSHDTVLKANRKNKILDFTIYRNEGEIKLYNKEKNLYGSGGLDVFSFVKKNSNKILKVEYTEVKHLYNDESFKDYRNSEIRRVTIFFDENEKPDLAKIYENHYTSEKVLSSERYFLNLSSDQNYYKNSSTKALIDYVMEIANEYKHKKFPQK